MTTCYDRWPRKLPRRGSTGQTLVEFALVLMVFMVVTLGLVDVVRVIFYYSQIQEAARQGARWGSVQVARGLSDGTTPWGTFGDPGNSPGMYCPTCTNTVADSTIYHGATTIVGAVTLATTAVDLRNASITIATSIPSAMTATLQHYNDQITNKPVTVSVSYPFQPVTSIAFKWIINLTGTSTMLHE